MDNPNKVYLLYIEGKLESAWYNEENMLSEYQDLLDNGYTEEEVYYKTCYINDFNEQEII